ncbi:hypothetical protein QRX60_34215 [Amycolatopsis mongoliensis]|uniref:Uncharacterized protein n=1 Tax=Amycolatopsis mongoliensis TaxID=715475 RepID=A0A9Y2JIH4_9PSEU|nr:hypothetical protein [Amycolatopsis sp. 4-36]WIX99082.1 hypothetical protein QRX60_34215 [Amycolatopsis sp. 4-36]
MFPSAKRAGSRPLGIIPPTEGSLDRETWTRLIGVLTDHSHAGPATPCLAYYSPATLGLHHTDYDLRGTQVTGSPALIEALLNDDEIEGLRLPWAV